MPPLMPGGPLRGALQNADTTTSLLTDRRRRSSAVLGMVTGRRFSGGGPLKYNVAEEPEQQREPQVPSALFPNQSKASSTAPSSTTKIPQFGTGTHPSNAPFVQHVNAKRVITFTEVEDPAPKKKKLTFQEN